MAGSHPYLELTEQSLQQTIPMDQLIKQRSQALTALLVLAIIWGYNWVVMKSALQYAGPFQFAAMRTFFGALVLFLVLYVTRRSMTLTEFPTMLVLGLLQNVGFTGGKTAVLTYTMPFWTLLFAWPILGERIHSWQWLAVISAVMGMVFIFDPLHIRADAFSMVLAILSGISWALSAIMTKTLHKRHPELDLINLTAWPMLLGSLPMVVIAWLVPAPPIVWAPYLIGAVFFNVVFCGALAWLLWLFALQRLPAGIASMGSMLAPVIGVIAAWIQLGEVPDHMELTGMVLIAFALLVISWVTLREQPRR